MYIQTEDYKNTKRWSYSLQERCFKAVTLNYLVHTIVFKKNNVLGEKSELYSSGEAKLLVRMRTSTTPFCSSVLELRLFRVKFIKRGCSSLISLLYS